MSSLVNLFGPIVQWQNTSFATRRPVFDSRWVHFNQKWLEENKMTEEYQIIDTDQLRRLCRKYSEQHDSNTRKKLIKISRGRSTGRVTLVGESGADKDDAITALTMTIGGPW